MAAIRFTSNILKCQQWVGVSLNRKRGKKKNNKTYKVLVPKREMHTKGDICKTLLTFNNVYTHTHTTLHTHVPTTYIYPAKVFKRLVSGV